MAEYKAGRRERAPTHPGAILRRALKALDNRSVRQAAIDMGVTSQALNAVANENSAVTPEMALRLGKYFGNGPELWLNMQTDYDLWRARQSMKGALAKIRRAEAEA